MEQVPSIQRYGKGLGLVALFLVSFALPILILYFAGFLSSDAPTPASSNAAEIFPNAVTVSSLGQYLEVAPSDGLVPAAGKDFLLVGWFRLRKLPDSGEKIVILANFEEGARSRRGYALSLTREEDTFRPSVYWTDSEGTGGWHAFADIRIGVREWFMLALSFYDDTKLGLHSIRHRGEFSEIKLLGGYVFEEPVIPESESLLRIGAFHDAKFTGKIGPIGIFSSADLSADLQPILESFRDSPTKLPSQLGSENLLLWSLDGESDLSSAKREVKFVKGKRKKGKGKKKKG